MRSRPAFRRRSPSSSAYDVVVLSDIGANSFLLTDETFLRSEQTTNRLVAAVRLRSRRGGGLVMVGGYMSFSGHRRPRALRG